MASSAANGESLLSHATDHVNFLLQNSPIYGHLLQSATVSSASPGRVVVHLPLAAIHLNSKGTLHGSVSATIVDFMGGVAIAASNPPRTNTGVSTDMHISFLGAAREGETVEIEGKAERVGGTLAFTRITIRKAAEKEGEGDIVAIGTHTKYFTHELDSLDPELRRLRMDDNKISL